VEAGKQASGRGFDREAEMGGEAGRDFGENNLWKASSRCGMGSWTGLGLSVQVRYIRLRLLALGSPARRPGRQREQFESFGGTGDLREEVPLPVPSRVPWSFKTLRSGCQMGPKFCGTQLQCNAKRCFPVVVAFGGS
jgi:hypothetical protein